MSRLVVEITDSTTSAEVEVVVLDERGDVVVRSRRDVDLAAPETVWRGVLSASGEVVNGVRGELPGAVSVIDRSTTLVVWDAETLGSPRPALLHDDDDMIGDRIERMVALEPHLWALVLEGQYALGTYESYLVARMSRGTYHVTDVAHAARTGLLDPETGSWSIVRCEQVGVPLDALPEIVVDTVLARTEPGSFVGLDLPVRPDPR